MTHPHAFAQKHLHIASKGNAFLANMALVAAAETARLTQDTFSRSSQGVATEDIQSLTERHLAAAGVEFHRNAPNPTGRTFGYLMVPGPNGDRIWLEFFYCFSGRHIGSMRKMYGKFMEKVYVVGCERDMHAAVARARHLQAGMG